MWVKTLCPGSYRIQAGLFITNFWKQPELTKGLYKLVRGEEGKYTIAKACAEIENKIKLVWMIYEGWNINMKTTKSNQMLLKTFTFWGSSLKSVSGGRAFDQSIPEVGSRHHKSPRSLLPTRLDLGAVRKRLFRRSGRPRAGPGVDECIEVTVQEPTDRHPLLGWIHLYSAKKKLGIILCYNVIFITSVYFFLHRMKNRIRNY